jgi:phosphoesterase RecJ-like protein
MNKDRSTLPASAWATNATPEQIVARLREAIHAAAAGGAPILLFTHAKPDGDAAGSTLALCRAINLAAGRDAAQVWYAGPFPRWLDELAAEPAASAPIRKLGGTGIAPVTASQHPAILVLDTGSWPQLTEVELLLRANFERAIVIDHHLHGDADSGATKLIETAAAATTEVVAPICVGLLGLDGPAELPRPIAEPLYLGLATDTGWFHHSNVRAATMRLAADLIDAGVDTARLYQLVEQRDGPSRWRLLGRALNSLQLRPLSRGGDVALMRLSLDDFARAGANRNDTGGFADMVMSIESVRVCAVLSEGEIEPGEPPLTKISLRSKAGPGEIDVNEISRSLGGGGHARAAGARVRAPLDEAERQLLAALDAK